MAKLIWDEPGERQVYSGVDRGVLYPLSGSGVAWNGLTEISDTTSSDESSIFIDGAKSFSAFKSEGHASGIRAYTYPDELEEYLEYSGLRLSNQRPKRFHLTYRTFVNDEEQIHILYNIFIKRDDTSYDQSPSTTEFSWSVSTVPVRHRRGTPTAYFVIKVSDLQENSRAALYDALYGTDLDDPYLPSVEGLLDLIEEQLLLRIIDNGDGTWTAIGPDDAIKMLDESTFEIDWPSAIFLTSNMYSIEDFGEDEWPE